MSNGDGRHPKFRILCKRCNSYQHTVVRTATPEEPYDPLRICITCRKCLNTANSFDEEAS
jgi:hypothetical protein